LPARPAGTSAVRGDYAAAPANGPVRFGVAPQRVEDYDPASSAPRNVDIVVVGGWMLKDGAQGFHVDAVRKITAAGKTPYLFAYIAADTVKKNLGAGGDCDGNSGAALCTQGTDQIRSVMSGQILPTYQNSARMLGEAAGGKEVLIHFEPDWFQYSEPSQSKPFSKQESDDFRNQMLGAIKSGCPSCKVVIDFSPWFSPGKTSWAQSVADFYGNVDRDVVKYAGLVGKPFNFTEGKVDNYTYAEMTQELGLPLMVISAYTYGGGPIPLDESWLNQDAINRAQGWGVAGVILAKDQPEKYDAFLASRPSGAQQQPQNQQQQQPQNQQQQQPQNQQQQPQNQQQQPQNQQQSYGQSGESQPSYQ
jgi:hypothetical protein